MKVIQTEDEQGNRLTAAEQAMLSVFRQIDDRTQYIFIDLIRRCGEHADMRRGPRLQLVRGGPACN